MKIKELELNINLENNKKLLNAVEKFNNLLTALRNKEIPDTIIQTINDKIDQLNTDNISEKELKKQIIKSQSSILKLVEKKLQFVTKHHYRNMWLALGMAIFGIPLGVVFGTSFGNMAFLGVGLPIGMVIGIAVGTGIDKKALQEGRQIDFVVN